MSAGYEFLLIYKLKAPYCAKFIYHNKKREVYPLLLLLALYRKYVLIPTVFYVMSLKGPDTSLTKRYRCIKIKDLKMRRTWDL